MNALQSYNAFLDGDKQALSGLVESYFKRLTAFIYGYVKNVSDAEDICEDCFLYLIEKRRRFAVEQQLTSYLYMTAKSRSLNFLKKSRRLARLEDDHAVEDFGDEIFSDEKKRAVYDALNTLDELSRDAVYLVYFENLTYAEAARIIGVSAKKIDNLLYSAKKKLSAVLKEIFL